MHPIAFQLGPLSIHWYGVMVALGFLAGLWTAGRRGLRAGIAAEKIMDLGPWLIIGAIVGARTLYVISYWRESFAGKPIAEIFMVWKGGLVYYGGLIGASLACILYTRLKKLPLWKVADILAPSIALGYVFGRIGCLLNGCCYGRACNLPWAIRFPAGNPLNPPTYPVHPTEVYDSLLNLGLYACAGLAVSAQEVRWAGLRRLSGELCRAALVCGDVPRRLSRAPALPGRLGHAGAPGQHPHPRGGPGAAAAAAAPGTEARIEDGG